MNFLSKNSISVLHKLPNISAWAGLLGGFAFSLCQWFIFSYAPIEKTMGITQKIFYYHMPLAWWGFVSFFVVFIASIMYLVQKKPIWDSLAGAAASTGLVFIVLALITGSIWGKFAWGVWWAWDARLTTTLIMCFIYAGYVLLRQTEMPEAKRASITAVVGIIAFLDVPLVFISARLWSYIHPPSISLDPLMKQTLILCICSFSFLWISLLCLGYYQAELEKRLKSLTTKMMLRQQ